MLPAGTSAAGLSAGRLIKLLALLWLAGVAMRMTILAMPPVIPMVHRDLGMSETEIGLLIGLPLAVFAIAAIPGSLLIARIGARLAVVAGMVVAALAGGARGGAGSVATLYLAAIVTGFGIAIMQPGMPTLVREWLPQRIALGTLAYSAGMLMGASLAPVLTIPLVLPLVRGSWRLALLFWAVPALLIAPLFLLFSPKLHDHRAAGGSADRARWWPDWKNPLVWLLGIALGSNNTPYFATNAFLGDYLNSEGKGDLLGQALGWLNGAQIVALIILFVSANRLQRRAWPFVLFGPLMLAAFLMLIFCTSAPAIVGAAGLIGLTSAVTLTPTLALPAFICAPGDVARTAAGMFTVSYTVAIIVPTLCGALWDATGRPWSVFVPLCVCTVTLTVFGAAVTRFRPPAASIASGGTAPR